MYCGLTSNRKKKNKEEEEEGEIYKVKKEGRKKEREKERKEERKETKDKSDFELTMFLFHTPHSGTLILRGY